MPHTINVNTGTKREDQTRLKPCHIQYHFSKHNIFSWPWWADYNIRKWNSRCHIVFRLLEFILFHLLRFDFCNGVLIHSRMICLNQFRIKRSWNLTSIATTIEGFFLFYHGRQGLGTQRSAWFQYFGFLLLISLRIFVLMFVFFWFVFFFGYSIVMCRGGWMTNHQGGYP